MNLHTLPGRVRLRAPALRKALVVWPLQAEIEKLPGIQAAVFNPRVGSLLIRYDPATLPQERLLAVLDEHLPTGLPRPAAETIKASKPLLSPDERKALAYAMLSTLGTSLLGLAIDSKKVHWVSGLLFLGGLLLHLGDKRKFLLP